MEPRRAINRLVLARLISQTGAMAGFTTLGYHLFALTGSPLWQSAGMLAAISVGGAVQPYAGALADRLDRRRLMIASDVASGLVFLVLVPLADEPVALVALLALASVVGAPFNPASRAAIPNLVPPERLAWANGRLSAANAAGVVLGPGLAAALLAGPGAGSVFLVNAATFGGSALLVSTLRSGSFSAAPTTSARPGPEGASAGLRAIRTDRGLTLLLLGEVVAYSGIGVALTADAPIASAFEQREVGYATMIVAWGVGALTASLAVGRLLRLDTEARWLVAGMATLALGCFVIGGAPIWAIVVLGNLVGGSGMGTTDTSRQTLVQRRVEDAVAGRVFATLEFAAVAALALGTALAGPVIDALGARWPYTICGITFALGGAIQLGLVRLPAPARATD